MEILLVTASDLLPVAFNTVLNPSLKYCTIVVDELDSARKFFAQNNYFQNLLRPFYELNECINNFYYDFIICISPENLRTDMTNEIYKYEKNLDKVINFNDVHTAYNFIQDLNLRYYQEHIEEIEIFVTGISYSQEAFIPNRFKYKLMNFAVGSQDLYYDYQVAKRVITPTRGGGRIKFALLGLAPYSFNYDLSKSKKINFRLLKYLIALKDLHNFSVSIDDYKNLLNKDYLELKIPITNMRIDRIKSAEKFIDSKTRITARNEIDHWKDNFFPNTREENLKILDEYLTFCEENNVKSIMFLPPMSEGYVTHFCRKMLNEFYYLIKEILQKHPGSYFVDGWKLKNFGDSDFRDITHLNKNGAIKFSDVLNNLIEKIENNDEKTKIAY